MERKRRNPRF